MRRLGIHRFGDVPDDESSRWTICCFMNGGRVARGRITFDDVANAAGVVAEACVGTKRFCIIECQGWSGDRSGLFCERSAARGFGAVEPNCEVRAVAKWLIAGFAAAAQRV